MFVFSSVFLRLSLLTRQGRDDVTCKRRGRRFLFFLSFLFTRKKQKLLFLFQVNWVGRLHRSEKSTATARHSIIRFIV